VSQDTERWNRQYKTGTWDYLLADHPNTTYIADAVLQIGKAHESPLRVLDVGCGNGALSRLLASSFLTIKYTGYDVSPAAIDAARAAVPGAVFVVASADEPPEDLGTFDVIVFNEVLYYLNPERVLQMHKRYAGPETRVIVSIICSWRSPFLWHRIRSCLSLTQRSKIHDPNRGNRFDIAIGSFPNL